MHHMHAPMHSAAHDLQSLLLLCSYRLFRQCGPAQHYDVRPCDVKGTAAAASLALCPVLYCLLQQVLGAH